MWVYLYLIYAGLTCIWLYAYFTCITLQYLVFFSDFSWLDGSAVDFLNWGPGEPNGGATNSCVDVSVQAQTFGRWDDVTCGDTYGYVCKY